MGLPSGWSPPMIGLRYVPVTASARIRGVLGARARAAETTDVFRTKRRRVIIAGQVYLRARPKAKRGLAPDYLCCLKTRSRMPSSAQASRRQMCECLVVKHSHRCGLEIPSYREKERT